MQQKPLSKVVFLLTIIAFGFSFYLYRPFGLYFLNDDLIHIPLSERGIFGQRNSVRLFNDLIIYVDTLLYGKHAWGYHLTNLLFHAGTGILLYFLIRQLQNRRNVPGGRGFGLLCAILFFVYPFHSESVFWIIGRGSIISAFFLLLAFYLYGKKEKNITAGIFSIIAFVIALLTYESVWCFFIILFFLSRNHVNIKPGNFFQEFIWAAFWVIAFIIFLVFRWQTTGSLYGVYEWNSVQQNPVSGMMGNFARLLLRSIAPPMQHGSWFAAISLVLFTLFAFGIWKTYRRYPQFRGWIGALMACYVISLLPYVSLGIDTHGTESERFLYLPSLFICLLLATLVSSIRKESLQIAWASAIFIYSIGFLWLSSNNYRLASEIVQKTFIALNNSSGKKYVVFQQVPGDYKGAVLFRLGLREGWEWLKEKPLPDSVIIASYSENDRLFEQTDIRTQALQNNIQVHRYYNNDGAIIQNTLTFDRANSMLITYDSAGLKVFE